MLRDLHKLRGKTYETLFREKDHFKLKFDFASSRIHINIQRLDSNEAFDIFITQESVEKNPTLRLVYGSIEGLFLSMRESIEQISIDDDGIVTISIQLQMMSRVSTKTVKLYPSASESAEANDIQSHLNELAEERNKYVANFHSHFQSEIHALRSESRIVKERMMKFMPEKGHQPHHQPQQQYISPPPQQHVPPPPQQHISPHPQQIPPPDQNRSPRKNASFALPVSHERIVKSPTIIEQKTVNQTNACKCAIM